MKNTNVINGQSSVGVGDLNERFRFHGEMFKR
jgi:hypothetical protein